MDKRTAVKVFGERNTGTNYLVKLLQLNTDAEILRGTLPRGLARAKEKLEQATGGNWYATELFMDLCFWLTRNAHLGWKHGAPNAGLLERYSRKQKLLVITLSRNPYSWLMALHKRPYHARGPVSGMSFENFLSTPWKSVARDNGPRYFETPVHLWNFKTAALLKLDHLKFARVIHGTFEGLLRDPEGWIDSLSREGKLVRKIDKFENYHEATKAEGGRDHAYYRDYYGRELWREKLSSEAIGLVNRHLDLDLCRRFGYEVLATEASPA